MTHLTPFGLIRILGQVTAILLVTMVGGAVVGIALDQNFGTTPLLFFAGFGLGNVLAIVGIGLLIRNGLRKLRAPASEPSLGGQPPGRLSDDA